MHNQPDPALVPDTNNPLPRRQLAQRPRDPTSLAAVLCLLFGLRATEGRLLAELLAYDFRSKHELRTALANAGVVITNSTTAVFIWSLRKRLAPYGIRITSIPTLGYGLDRMARSKIHKLIASHDAGVMPSKLMTIGVPTDE